ncbi:hypothetical protein BH23PSE1_BH23PSE1_16490 [soil metagenome]
MERRDVLKATVAGLLGAAGATGVAAPAAQEPAEARRFDFDLLVARAEAAARRDFEAQPVTLAAPFADLGYDGFRGITLRDEAAIRLGTGRFGLSVMPPGSLFRRAVRLHLVKGGMARELPFSADFFHFDPRYFPYGEEGRAPAGIAPGHGFSGFRLLYPINRPDGWAEVAAFQGASYFRAIARGMLFGLSARGLAIGTGEPEPEEFPLFTAFWIEKPAGEAAVRVHALLDGPSVAGAYAFTIRPGRQTAMEVRCVLFPRVELDKVGIAPLTSMYFFGSGGRAGIDDFRGAVHDSDGLQIVNGAGETLWRPLVNPPGMQISAFQDDGPRAFGLIQRPRGFDHE